MLSYHCYPKKAFKTRLFLSSVNLKTSFFFKTCLLQKNQLNLQERFTKINLTMTDIPSYNGIGSRSKTVLRTTRKGTENSVTTQRPAPSTPSPRGHA